MLPDYSNSPVQTMAILHVEIQSIKVKCFTQYLYISAIYQNKYKLSCCKNIENIDDRISGVVFTVKTQQCYLTLHSFINGIYLHQFQSALHMQVHVIWVNVR